MNRRSMLLGLVAGLCCSPLMAQTGEAMASPPAKAEVALGPVKVTVDYHTPLMRGRKIMGGLVPYGQVWRTGANEATTFVVSGGDVSIAGKPVAAGSYTIYTLPSETGWKLIISMETGQWGTEYHADRDLVRVDMDVHKLPAPQEKMSISFESTVGKRTDMHVKWETTDVSVPILAK
ncbi:DUF2911 domain-containing protein [Terriglobus tenax]|uniref:DUF2911 domain-containing protein n=1 Tax=Terriglobus tenax TaxID=1111115 RepID=UPI0021DF5F54|nr:DUF2911 domain-containing protein [Terriglobus tenax]